MVERKKACVIYVPEDNIDPAPVIERLGREGFDVHPVAVSAAAAAAIKAGNNDDVSAEAKSCLADADVIVVLITQSAGASGGIGGILTAAQNQRSRIVGAWGGGTAIAPKAITDYGDALVRSDSDSFRDAVCGRRRIWEAPSGEKVRAPKKKHQKCQ
ncbi:MAG TPA: hypothetical protein VD846_11490 [Allosphingosinicella sp.]|nr:hypothetical protein [Allosphingosinicella sp.]